jgi:outer membrane biosynthesis protein TonB
MWSDLVISTAKPEPLTLPQPTLPLTTTTTAKPPPPPVQHQMHQPKQQQQHEPKQQQPASIIMTTIYNERNSHETTHLGIGVDPKDKELATRTAHRRHARTAAHL